MTRGSARANHATTSTQRVVSDIVTPAWQYILGSHQKYILGIAASILAAYFLAAIAQRVLLGRYAISAGPFSIPDLTTELVASLRSTLDTIEEAPGPETPPEAPGPEAPPKAPPAVVAGAPPAAPGSAAPGPEAPP